MPLFSLASVRIFFWIRLVVFLVIAGNLRLTIGDNTIRRRADVPALARKDENNNSDRCWIFTHMPKSGGSTVKKILNAWFGKENVLLYNSDAWKRGEKYAARFERQGQEGSRPPWRLAVGGYAEVLRRHGGQRCTWFTLFRHPINRLVSAFYYCRKKPRDQACASAAMLAEDADLVDFARLWGSFGLRQYTLGRLDIDAVMRSARSADDRARLPGWYLVKQTLTSGGDDADAAALRDALEPAKVLLRDEYTAVGILEEFNTTLHLFDSQLAMPGLDWWGSFVRHGVVNKNHRVGVSETAAAVEAAWRDDRIKYFLRLDIELYEHAVLVFHDQASRAGLYPD